MAKRNRNKTKSKKKMVSRTKSSSSSFKPKSSLLANVQRISLSVLCLLLAIAVTMITSSTNSILVEGKTLFGMFGNGENRRATEHDGLIDDIPTTTLRNKNTKFPLVGVGVGNLQPDLVETTIVSALQSDHRIRLIDTARASNNEKSVASGIVKGVHNFLEVKNKDKKKGDIVNEVQVHVVTKIWYTHLGYERTKVSVQESLDALEDAILDESIDLNVHVLIHWPRCYDGIPWMNCEQEENALPDDIKRIGPPPHLDKENAWKESWRALEEMYSNHKDYPMISSIGVSNFSGDDLQELLYIAKIKPMILQMNVWSLLNDPNLVNLCNKHNIHMQVYNVMNGIVNRGSVTPHAAHHLALVANEITKKDILSASMDQGEEVDQTPVTPGQVVLKWLTQMGISVIPRTTNKQRLIENSAISLGRIPPLSEENLEITAHAMEALLSGNDLEEDVHVKVTFHANSTDMFLYWFNPEGNVEKQISYIAKGESFEESTHPQHLFRIYNAYDPDVYKDYTVTGLYGDHDHVHIEL